MAVKQMLGALALSGLMVSGSVARCADTELFGYMESMRDNLQVITRNVRGGNLDAIEQEASAFAQAVEAATREVPYALSNGSSADLKDYQDVIGDLHAAARSLEDAVLAGDQATATAALNEMSQIRRTGHGRFKARSC